MQKLIHIAAAISLFAAASLAGQGVPTPYITGGSHRLTTDGYYRADAPDARQLRQRLTYDYGYSDRLQLRSRLVWQDDRAGNFRAEELELAAISAFNRSREYWLDSGLYGGLHLRDDGSSMWTGRLLLAKRLEPWEFRSNLILRNDFGNEANQIRPEARWRFSYVWRDMPLSTGIEYFGRYGSFDELHWRDASHQIGPVAVWNPLNRLIYSEIGAVIGLTDETEDALIKWRVGVRF